VEWASRLSIFCPFTFCIVRAQYEFTSSIQVSWLLQSGGCGSFPDIIQRSRDGGANLDLVFITQTGPKKTKEAQSQIRRHVMKDIGKSRRKDGKRAMPLRFTLEVPDSLVYLV
jgi:hypothetical protein